MVERVIGNDEVGSSILPSSTISLLDGVFGKGIAVPFERAVALDAAQQRGIALANLPFAVPLCTTDCP